MEKYIGKSLLLFSCCHYNVSHLPDENIRIASVDHGIHDDSCLLYTPATLYCQESIHNRYAEKTAANI